MSKQPKHIAECLCGKCPPDFTPKQEDKFNEFVFESFIRDACSAYPKPKSEMRTRLKGIIASAESQARADERDKQFLILNAVSAKGWSLEKYLNVESAKRELDSPTK